MNDVSINTVAWKVLRGCFGTSSTGAIFHCNVVGKPDNSIPSHGSSNYPPFLLGLVTKINQPFFVGRCDIPSHGKLLMSDSCYTRPGRSDRD